MSYQEGSSWGGIGNEKKGILQMNRDTHIMLSRLESLGISTNDALALRRISLALHSWFELECGNGNNHGSWAIVRGGYVHNEEGSRFEHDDDGKPYLEHHHYLHGKGQDYVSYRRLPDRERGARQRLRKLLKRYPDLEAYIQTDPRGVALYVLRKADLADRDPSQVYNSVGIAIYK
jgi:hypothetical protein